MILFACPVLGISFLYGEMRPESNPSESFVQCSYTGSRMLSSGHIFVLYQSWSKRFLRKPLVFDRVGEKLRLLRGAKCSPAMHKDLFQIFSAEALFLDRNRGLPRFLATSTESTVPRFYLSQASTRNYLLRS